VPKMLRPKATVLPDAALVPAVEPGARPTHFTHQVVAEQPFHRADRPADAAPDGRFAPGTKLLLLARSEGAHCLVQNADGICAVTAFDGLEPLC
jgi:hypothetical protein